MAQADLLNQETLKRLLKEALAETLTERRDLLEDAFAGVLEDWALAEAIREGRQAGSATPEEIFGVLKGQS